MRSWWRCRSRRFDIGRQAGRQAGRQEDKEADRRSISPPSFTPLTVSPLPSSRGAVEDLGGLTSFVTCHIGLPCDYKRLVARRLSGCCSEKMSDQVADT